MPLATMPTWLIEGGPTGAHRLPYGEVATWLVAPHGIASHLIEEKLPHVVRGYVRLATDKTVRSRNKVDVVNLATLGQQLPSRVISRPGAPDTPTGALDVPAGGTHCV